MEYLKILTVYDRLYLRKARFMQKVTLGECPPDISELFQEWVPNENKDQNIHLLPRGHTFKQSIKYSGPIIWNSLPSGLKLLDNTDTFHSSFIKWIKNP